MDWKRVLTGFAFACFGALGLMASMPLLLGICDPTAAWCPKEPNILVYFAVVVSLLLLIVGMGTLLRAGNASYRETHPKKEKPAKQPQAYTADAINTPAPPAHGGFDREAVLAEMKTQPVFGNARRRPLQSAATQDAAERVYATPPFERPQTQSATDEPALQTPVPPVTATAPIAPTPPARPSSAFAGDFEAHMASSPMAPRLAPKTPIKE